MTASNVMSQERKNILILQYLSCEAREGQDTNERIDIWWCMISTWTPTFIISIVGAWSILLLQLASLMLSFSQRKRATWAVCWNTNRIQWMWTLVRSIENRELSDDWHKIGSFESPRIGYIYCSDPTLHIIILFSYFSHTL